MVIVKALNGKIFGGFTTLSWRYNDISAANQDIIEDNRSIVFSCSNKSNHVYPEKKITLGPNIGPCFEGSFRFTDMLDRVEEGGEILECEEVEVYSVTN